MWIIQDGLKVVAGETDIFMCYVSLEEERWHQCTLFEWEKMQRKKHKVERDGWKKLWNERSKENQVRQEDWGGEKSMKRRPEDDWLKAFSLRWWLKERKWKWRDDAEGTQEDDTNGLWTSASSFYGKHELNIGWVRALEQAMVLHAKQSWQKHWFSPSSSSRLLH